MKRLGADDRRAEGPREALLNEAGDAAGVPPSGRGAGVKACVIMVMGRARLRPAHSRRVARPAVLPAEFTFSIRIDPGERAGALWTSTRPGNGLPWAVPVNLGPALNSPSPDLTAFLSDDGTTLLFASDRGGGSGGRDLYVSTRTVQPPE